jgi:hypothetical protein
LLLRQTCFVIVPSFSPQRGGGYGVAGEEKFEKKLDYFARNKVKGAQIRP